MNNHANSRLSLGRLIRHAREAKHLSIRDLAELSRMGRSTLLDLEQDRVATPNPANLQVLAATLELDLADVYAAAGYTTAEGLPSFTPYLRSKYANLPDAAKRELESSFARIAEKYGYDGDGPQPGQDESDES